MCVWTYVYMHVHVHVRMSLYMHEYTLYAYTLYPCISPTYSQHGVVATISFVALGDALVTRFFGR